MKKGMTLFIAITVTSSALLIALGIFQIVFGQIRLSQSARESHKALYSANIGQECALYYMYYKEPDPAAANHGYSYWGPEPSDICFYKRPGGPDPERSFCRDVGDPGNKCHAISCGGLEVIPIIDDGITCNRDEEQRFQFTIDDPAQSICANVDIRTQRLSDGLTNYYRTIITSNGWNTCNVSASNRVNRTIEFRDCADTTGSGATSFPCT